MPRKKAEKEPEYTMEYRIILVKDDSKKTKKVFSDKAEAEEYGMNLSKRYPWYGNKGIIGLEERRIYNESKHEDTIIRSYIDVDDMIEQAKRRREKQNALRASKLSENI